MSDSATQVVYGRNPVRELLAAGRREVHELWASAEVAGETWIPGDRVRAADRARLGRLAGTSDHQGVVAIAGAYPYGAQADLLRMHGPLMCLDGAQDPRNLGAVARVCEGAGIGGLLIAARGGVGVTSVALKTSAGALEHLLVVRSASLPGLVHDVREAGRMVIGADSIADRDYRAGPWPWDALIVLGAEGEGLRPRVRRLCDALVTIPMRGRVDSLNLSVAAALLAYEITRSRD